MIILLRQTVTSYKHTHYDDIVYELKSYFSLFITTANMDELKGYFSLFITTANMDELKGYFSLFITTANMMIKTHILYTIELQLSKTQKLILRIIIARNKTFYQISSQKINRWIVRETVFKIQD